MIDELIDLSNHEPTFDYWEYRKNKNEDCVSYIKRILKKRDDYWRNKITEVIEEVQPYDGTTTTTKA